VEDIVALAVERLREAGVRLERGLSDAELDRVPYRFGFEFCAVHRRLLSLALPAGSEHFPRDGWPDWRSGSAEDLRARLSWPVEGIIFDVLNSGFWPPSWGARPLQAAEAEASARDLLKGLPDALFGEPVAGFLAHRQDDGQVVDAGLLDDRDAWPFWSVT
jgi:hypothetical protein